MAWGALSQGAFGENGSLNGLLTGLLRSVFVILTCIYRTFLSPLEIQEIQSITILIGTYNCML